MPIYEYICPNCGNTFEKLVRLSASAADITCPACGSEAKKKLSLISTSTGGDHSPQSSVSSCAPGGT